MGVLFNVDNGGTDRHRVVDARTLNTPHDANRCFVDGLDPLPDRSHREDELVRLPLETGCRPYRSHRAPARRSNGRGRRWAC